MSEYVKWDLYEQGYGMITLYRPERRNALSFDMIEELQRLIRDARNLELKALVITGAGTETFCAGGDLNDFHADLSSQEAFSALYPMKEVLYELSRFPVPTIALLNGHTRGGGCELATACDFRYATEGSTIGFVQGKLGISPGWGGGAMLYQRIHPLKAYEMLVQSRVYSTEEAIQLGWLQGIIHEDTLAEDIDHILQPFLQKNLDQLIHFKQQYVKQQIPLSLSADMDDEVRRCSNLWGNEAHKEAVERFQKS
ncbi:MULTISPECIES: enoyl-CoA hydratase/isomerase family protein [Pontibacillus]|uniref:Ethylmalonyl-CoA decarboxylase n=1 Tax=Pontibacillus chungwhensis TaxID=265426 RepID=A0ABY8V235_9BACI|nr:MULTISPECIES: enoyl-CoA hydratase/isomerase family protein [Pontibacillus]MCD5322577.1 enoyl-CoA hydratase/isomerase family protein [Pontibacillus sp. HN14]WIF99862.1 enoyl-CoA hydratase/isomerase family protein [Pontibacillus chungwhensis]